MISTTIYRCKKCGLKKVFEFDIAKTNDKSYAESAMKQAVELKELSMNHAGHVGYVLTTVIDKPEDMDELVAEIKKNFE